MKNQNIYSILLFCMLFSFQNAHGQSDTMAIRGFQAFANDPIGREPEKKYNNKAVKLSVLFFTTGKYGVSFETMLSRSMGFEIEAGATGRNYVGFAVANVFQEEFNSDEQQDSPNFSSDLDYYDKDYSFKGRKTNIGWYVAAMPRLYYDNDNFDGGYVGFNFQYRRYNFTAYNLEPTTGTIYMGDDDPVFDKSAPTIDEYENNLIFGATWGYQTVNENANFDLSLSVGVNNITAERRDIGRMRIPSGIGGSYKEVYTVGSKPRTLDKTRLYFEFSFKIGISWK